MAFQNPFQSMRRRNILAPSSFNQEGPSKPKMSFGIEAKEPDPYQPPKQRTYEDDISDLQSQSGPGLEAYKDYLTRLPKREDSKPGVMTRIAAALSGGAAGLRDPGAGIKVAQDVNSSSYRNALSDYANEGVGLKERSDMEQDELDSKLRALSSARAMGLKYDEFDLKRREAGNKNAIDLQNSESGRIRADAYAKTQGRPRHQYRDQEDGSILEINEDDGTQRVIPGKSLASGQLGVSRGQLGVSQRNAATAEGNLGVNKDRATAYGRGVDATIKRGDKAASPRIQQDAEDRALTEMMSDPLFKDFVGLDDKGFPAIKGDPDDPDYQDFLEALDAKKAEVLAGTSRRRTGGR